MITSFVKYFFGSTPDDFDPATKNHPFKPCPSTPNCAVHSVEYPVIDMELFEAGKAAIDNLSPLKTEVNSQSLQIDVVFNIRPFGFKDDVRIIIQSEKPGQSILYIRSASRVGRNDFGVNRRRIKRILSAINKQIS